MSQLPTAVVRIVFTLMAFALGVFGFARAYAPADGVGVSDLISYSYKSLQLIVGRFPEELSGRDLPWSLQIARFALPLTAAFATLTVAWTQVRNTLRSRLIVTRGEHLVVSGDASLAARVARKERKAKRPVLLWTADTRADWVEEAEEFGAPHLPVKGEDRGAERIGLGKARGLLLAGPDDAANVALASAALDAALRSRAAGDPLTIIARVDDPDLRGPLERRFDGSGERNVARVRFASLPDIAARQLFLNAPLDRFQVGEQPERRLYILGFNGVAERYVLRLLAGAHYRGGLKPDIVVLDHDAERKRAVFQARRPGAASLAPVRFVQAQADQAALVGAAIDAAVSQYGPPTSVLIDPADTGRSLALALAVEEHWSRRGEISPPVQVHMPTEAPGDDLGCATTPFGSLDTLADPELLLQEKLDDLARAIHDFYFEGRLEEGDKVGSRGSMHEWEELAEAVRDDNRLAADCYRLKLRDVGARLLPQAGQGARFAFGPEELEELSRAEHDRWMAAKLIDGWRYAPKRDDLAKLHPDIVPYDDLTEPRKDLDREQIRVITRLAATAGQRAVRDLIVLVEPEGERALPLVQAAEAIRRHYPDRALVLLGAFEDAGTRATLAGAAGVADAIQFTVARDPDATVRGLERGWRAEARALYRTADRIYALPAHEWPEERRAAFARGRAELRLAMRAGDGQEPPTLVVGADGAVKAAPWAV